MAGGGGFDAKAAKQMSSVAEIDAVGTVVSSLPVAVSQGGVHLKHNLRLTELCSEGKRRRERIT